LARFNPDRTVAPIYDAAALWRERCLEADGSAFSDEKKLWTVSLLDELDRHFVQNLDEGEGDFFVKLKAQLSSASTASRQLMAEHLWILMLFQSNVGAAKKRDNVRQVWSWSGEHLSEYHPLLSEEVLQGIGSAGTAYNTERWRELVLLVAGVRNFKRRGTDERRGILADPWVFTDWLSGLPEARNRQLRHILPHLLFPDSFERISSEKDKGLILAAYTETSEKEIRKWDLHAIDRALLQLRRRLEQEHGADIDFYQDEFAPEWRAQTSNWLLSWNPSKWKWDSLAADRASTLAGEKVPNSWRCGSTKPREGDHVYLMRTGASPKGIVAAGMVTRAPYEAPHWDTEKADAGETARFIDVDFDAVRNADQDSIVELDELQRLEPKQEWNPQSSGIEIKGKPARTLKRLWKALPEVDRLSEPTASAGRAPATGTPALPFNIILYGPPGTGKTYRLMTEYLPRYKDSGEDQFEFITFHQSYAYEDFVEGIRPKTENGTVVYEVRPGALRRICERAKKAPEKRFALFIDEINRGNVAKIFGELISPIEIDKRIRTDGSGQRVDGCKGLEVTLPYSGDRFGVPANVDFIGTMNTADRSIALLDSALRRRFRFEELTPQPRLLKMIGDNAGGSIDLQQLLETINARLAHLLHRDQTIGHSYLYKVETFDELRRVVAREILPLLQEAFYDDWRQIRLVLADQSVSEEFQLVRARFQSAEQLFPGVDAAEIGDGEAFEIIREDEITPDCIARSTRRQSEVSQPAREGFRQRGLWWSAIGARSRQHCEARPLHAERISGLGAPRAAVWPLLRRASDSRGYNRAPFRGGGRAADQTGVPEARRRSAPSRASEAAAASRFIGLSASARHYHTGRQ
jgi:5-methylcytosine-specific restriction enzyme B